MPSTTPPDAPAAWDADVQPWPSVELELVSDVPMLVVPQWTDQPMNAWYVEAAWRTGVRRCNQRPRRSKLADVVPLARSCSRWSSRDSALPLCPSPAAPLLRARLEFSHTTAAICGYSNPVHRWFSRSGSGYGRPQGIIWGQSMRYVALLGKFQINRWNKVCLKEFGRFGFEV
jgi:hypothetical protein